MLKSVHLTKCPSSGVHCDNTTMLLITRNQWHSSFIFCGTNMVDWWHHFYKNKYTVLYQGRPTVHSVLIRCRIANLMTTYSWSYVAGAWLRWYFLKSAQRYCADASTHLLSSSQLPTCRNVFFLFFTWYFPFKIYYEPLKWNCTIFTHSVHFLSVTRPDVENKH
jgi:hypothetical protein